MYAIGNWQIWKHQALEHLDSSVDFAVDLDEHLNGSFRYGLC
jgi:hypothetical protein